MKSFFSLTLDSLEKELLANNYKSYNANQIFDWVYRKNCLDFNLMTNIKKELREYLINNYSLSLPKIVVRQEAKDKTIKYLFELEDSKKVEGVLMRQSYGNSVCVSSEVGCNMGCSFCASGLKKKTRNLLSEEMTMMVYAIGLDTKERVSSVVIMGTGEPLDNLEEVLKFIRTINSKIGLEIGIRHITLSTCGIVPKIYELSEENLGINLAISLHAPTNELRSKLMPINKVYPIEELIESVKYYFEKTKRRITFEYLMLDGINDSYECGIALSNLIKGLNAYVNLIPYNHVDEFSYKKSKESNVSKFYDTLKKCGINVTLRKKLGDDIDAACGQLRSKVK